MSGIHNSNEASPRLIRTADRALEQLASGEIDISYFQSHPAVYATGVLYLYMRVYDNQGAVIGQHDYATLVAQAMARAPQPRRSSRGRRRRVPATFSPTHDDNGKPWARGSGAAGPHARDGKWYGDQTDYHDYDQTADGGAEIVGTDEESWADSE